jgi:hypothetical protein
MQTGGCTLSYALGWRVLLHPAYAALRAAMAVTMTVIGDAEAQCAVADRTGYLTGNVARWLAVGLEMVNDGLASGDGSHYGCSGRSDTLGNFLWCMPLAQGALCDHILLEVGAQAWQAVQHPWATIVCKLSVIHSCSACFVSACARIMLAPTVDLFF